MSERASAWAPLGPSTPLNTTATRLRVVGLRLAALRPTFVGAVEWYAEIERSDGSATSVGVDRHPHEAVNKAVAADLSFEPVASPE